MRVVFKHRKVSGVLNLDEKEYSALEFAERGAGDKWISQQLHEETGVTGVTWFIDRDTEFLIKRF